MKTIDYALIHKKLNFLRKSSYFLFVIAILILLMGFMIPIYIVVDTGVHFLSMISGFTIFVILILIATFLQMYTSYKGWAINLLKTKKPRKTKKKKKRKRFN